ncbi:E3 ubiquitin-protein ligase UBR2-like [Ciona intestinalis]
MTMLTSDLNFADYFYYLLKLEADNLHVASSDWSVGSVLNKQTSHSILKNISRFILDGDETEVLLKLKELNNPSNICGRVFRPGEATYTCRSCAVDPTCVFCRECFVRSEHKNHKYKLHSSSGGGCCDCGDPEAWKQHPACSRHNVDQHHTSDDARTRLPTKLQENGEYFFHTLLKFVVDMFTVEHNEVSDLPPSLQSSSSVDKFATVVFNDESHTFDYVIGVLSHAVQCTNNRAADFATVIDREGRSTVLCGSKTQCHNAKELVTNPPHSTLDTLKTEVMHIYNVVYQEFALEVLAWLTKLAEVSEGLRLILCHILLKPQENGDSFTTMLMMSDTKLWKVARNAYHQLVMSTCLLFNDQKRIFAVAYVKAYPQLISQYLLDDHEHSESITSISVQLFTVPTLVHYLMVEHNLLNVITDTMISVCCVRTSDHREEHEISLKFDPRRLQKNLRRTGFCFYDLKYALTNVPTQWTQSISEKFQQFFANFAHYLASMEGMDAVVRKRDRHLEREQEWESGVTMHMRFIPIMRQLYKWCCVNKETTIECVRCVVGFMKSLYQRENVIKLVPYNGTTYQCVDYDITEKPVSVHYPLTRLLAGLFVKCGSLGIKFEEIGISFDILSLAEPSMRCLSLCGQVFAGAWRRNGLSLANQVFYCRDYRCRTESFNRDIQLLQACAANMDPNHFFVAILDKMNLMDDTRFEEHLTSFTEEFISILIFVVVERYIVGVGEVTWDEILKREVIHTLGDGAKPHSKIHKYLGEEAMDNPDWERILSEVADYKPSTSVNSVARYELKIDHLDHISPFFYHYNSGQANAHNEVLKRKKAKNLSLVFVPQPSPTFTTFYTNVPNLLTCQSLLHYLSSILRIYLPDGETRIQTTDKLFEKVLFLIQFGIVEEMEKVKINEDDGFKFCEKATEGELFSVLHILKSQDSVAIHKDTICWILNAVEKVKNLRSGNTGENEDGNTELQQASSSKTELERWVRKKKVEDRRKELMMQIKKMQEDFLEKNPHLEEEGEMEGEVVEEKKKRLSTDVPVCTLLSWQQASLKSTNENEMCILCQADNNNDPLVMSCMTQSALPANNGFDFVCSLDELQGTGIHVTTCSHHMHLGCWRQYFDSIKDREERRRTIRMRRMNGSYSTLKHEFLCPLCSRLSNCVIPSLSHESAMKLRNISASTITVQDWLRLIEDYVDPPKTSPQEFVVRFNVDMEATEDEQWHDAAESFVDTTEEMVMSQSSTVVMETEVDTTESALDTFMTCLLKNLKNMESPDTRDETLLLWVATVTTFQSEESVMRYQGRGVMTPPSIRVTQALSNLVRCFLFKMNQSQDTLQATREKLFKILLGKHEQSIVSMNVFAFFVLLTVSADGVCGALKCSSITNDKNILLLCCVAQLVQIMLMLDEAELQSEVANDDDNSDLLQLFNQIRSYALLPRVERISSRKLETCLVDSFRPFLRCCTLFMHHITNVTPNPTHNDDLYDMLTYLGLPSSILSMFDAGGTASLDPLVERWCKNPHLILRVSKPGPPNQTYPHCVRVRTLIDLDHDYSDMIERAVNFSCPRFKSKDDSVAPMICLACGTILCSQSYCCQQSIDGVNAGACTYHCTQCTRGAGNSGIFLKVRDCTIILLSGDRGCFKSAPYLDEFGETDQGLRRGNPITLDATRVADLNLIWLNHAVPESIVHEMESNRNLVNIDWNHL